VTEIRPSVVEPATLASDAPPLASARSRATGLPRADAADIVELDQAPAARVRLCVLCGSRLRAGQRVVRIQGSIVHARCSAVER
jgi:hypothetical protein